MVVCARVYTHFLSIESLGTHFYESLCIFCDIFFLLQCSDGLCISHQQSVYERGNTLGIVSKIVFISVHANEHLLFDKTVGVGKSRYLIIYLFYFLKRICTYRKWQRDQVTIFYTTLGKYLQRKKKHIKEKERKHFKKVP